MTSPLFAALARSATARAHLAGAESMAAEDLAHEAFADSMEPDAGHAERWLLVERCRHWSATRARYWRELATAASLAGFPWPEAHLLGDKG